MQLEKIDELPIASYNLLNFMRQVKYIYLLCRPTFYAFCFTISGTQRYRCGRLLSIPSRIFTTFQEELLISGKQH